MKRSFLNLYQKENFDNINQNSNMSIQQKIDINTNIEYQKYQVQFNIYIAILLAIDMGSFTIKNRVWGKNLGTEHT